MACNCNIFNSFIIPKIYTKSQKHKIQKGGGYQRKNMLGRFKLNNKTVVLKQIMSKCKLILCLLIMLYWKIPPLSIIRDKGYQSTRHTLSHHTVNSSQVSTKQRRQLWTGSVQLKQCSTWTRNYLKRAATRHGRVLKINDEQRKEN